MGRVGIAGRIQEKRAWLGSACGVRTRNCGRGRADRLSGFIKGIIPNCDEQDSSQFVVRSIATQAFLAVARARRRACQPAMSFTQCRLVLDSPLVAVARRALPAAGRTDPCAAHTFAVRASRLSRSRGVGGCFRRSSARARDRRIDAVSWRRRCGKLRRTHPRRRGKTWSSAGFALA